MVPLEWHRQGLVADRILQHATDGDTVVSCGEGSALTCHQPPAIRCPTVMLTALDTCWGQLAGWALHVPIPVELARVLKALPRVQPSQGCLP